MSPIKFQSQRTKNKSSTSMHFVTTQLIRQLIRDNDLQCVLLVDHFLAGMCLQLLLQNMPGFLSQVMCLKKGKQ